MISGNGSGRRERPVSQDVLALLSVISITVAVYGGSLGAALDVRQDDHRIVFAGSARPLHRQVLSLQDSRGRPIEPTVAWYLRSDSEEHGRFRPVTSFMEAVLPRVLGTNAFAWHLSVLLVAAAVAAALYLVGRRVGGTPADGIALSLMIMLAPDPGPAKVWYQMSVKAESVGTLLIVLSLLASLRAAGTNGGTRDDVVALALIAAAVLLKEPFVLLLPVLLAVRVGLPIFVGRAAHWRDVPRLRQVVIGYAMIGTLFIGAMCVVLALAPRHSYGTGSLLNWGKLSAGLFLTLKHVPQQAAGFGPVLVAVVVFSSRLGLNATCRLFRLALVLTALWVLPQIILYSLRGGMWDHYWIPCILGFAALNAWGLHTLRERGERVAYALAVILLVVWGLNGARVNWMAVENYVQRTLMRNDVVVEVARKIPSGGRIVIVADSKMHSEYATSWIFFLAHEGRPATGVLLYDVTESQRAGFSTMFLFPYGTAFGQLHSCDIDAIVFLDQPAAFDMVWKQWYESSCFNEKVFERPQLYYSIRELTRVLQKTELAVAFNRRLS